MYKEPYLTYLFLTYRSVEITYHFLTLFRVEDTSLGLLKRWNKSVDRCK